MFTILNFVIMKYSILIISLIYMNSWSQIGQKNFIDQPYIEVVGTFETEIVPNEIYIKITLNENDNKGKTSIEEQEKRIINELKLIGVNLDKNFSILDFDGFYKRKFLGDNEVLKIKNYQLIVNDGQSLGKVYIKLNKIGVSNISVIKVKHSEIDNLTRNAKLQALKIAKDKAEGYAKALDQSIGKALYVKEMPKQIPFHTNMVNNNLLAEYAYNEDQDKIGDLNFIPINIKASVQVKFALN